MVALHRISPRRRRGVVLVLILAMLGLLALIGVTFATFSGQAQVGARYYAESLAFPSSDEVMDFALSNLIMDSNNPGSAIRGHSLARDAYGTDGAFNGYLTTELATNSTLQIVNSQIDTTSLDPRARGHLQLVTNIPAKSPYYLGFNFDRWVVRLGGLGVEQTFHVVRDDNTGTDANYPQNR